MQQDYYQVLGVPKDATIAEIKKAYKKLVFKYHPDRNRDNLEEAEAIMKEINVAYEVLSNENKRADYDKSLNEATFNNENFSSNNFKDLSFKIGSRIIKYNKDMRRFTLLKRDFENFAINIGTTFREAYEELGSLDAFHEKGYDIGNTLIFIIIDKAVRICTKANRYDINVDRFLELDTDNIITRPWTEAFLAIDEEYIKIQDTILSEEQRRELRKNSRARMIGTGLGLEAGAVNLATGAIHSIFNSIGNAFTRANANNKKKAIYNNEKIILYLQEQLEKSIKNISIILAYEVFDLYPFEKNIQNAKAIIDNINANRIPTNHILDAILDALEINPFEMSLYNKGRQYLSGTDLKTLDSMAEFFGINELQQARIKQFLSFAKIYKEKNDMETALKWYEKAADLNSIEALFFLGNYYLEKHHNLELSNDYVLKATNLKLAMNYFEKAANLGDLSSLYTLGKYYFKNEEYSQSLTYFNQLLKKANKDTHFFNEASYYIGICYFNGFGTTIDYKKAYDLLYPLTNDKNPKPYILFIIAKCYFNGLGINQDICKSIKYFTEAAKRNLTDAQVFLVKYYLEGTTKNYSKAIPWLEKLAIKNNKKAKICLAKCYFNGISVPTNYKKAINLLNNVTLSDIQDDTDLLYNLGQSYYLGKDTSINYEKAISYLKPVAKQGNNQAQYFLGMSYYKLGDAINSAKWILEASNKNIDAQFQMALFYLNGFGVDKNYTKAFNIFSKLINQNYKNVSYYLAQCYLKGLGTEKNYTEAIKLLKKAKIEGNIEVDYDLGCCYYYGYGTNIDYVEAIKYFTESAKSNNKDSWYMLALCYEKGTGVTQNLENAFKFYYKAASLGQNDANFALGKCYENAIGTQKNIIEAIKYYEIAGKAGHKLALEQLKLLTEEKSVQKEINKYNKAVEKEIQAEEKAIKREQQKNSIKEGFSTGCGCLIWIIIIYFIYQWLFN